MAIIIDSGSRIIIQGMSGKTGRQLAQRMLRFHNPLVGGIAPGKGGEKQDGIMLFDTVDDAVACTGADTSMISIPAKFVCDAVLEAVDAGIRTIIIYSEGIPVQESLFFLRYAELKGVRVFGPNSAGVFSPGEANLSDIMDNICNVKKGAVGIVSKSGTLSYEAIDIIAGCGLGISTVACLGGDPVVGMDYRRTIELFLADDATRAIVMLGEIGGYLEIDAASTIRDASKPIIAYIAGQTAPPGKKMGHAGAIITKGDDSAEAKNKILGESGAITVPQISRIGEELRKLRL